ncbi:hypothetical protein Hamer_G027935 [Homarus americanus]|uniref:Uncharacterized protein n=1 Tax=Homarus americanus TaxID=6706 RepID=A0A8J5J9N9_HOMAM|nr:hypothetical protein Hamer_G027935 [Homarus americanus]
MPVNDQAEAGPPDDIPTTTSAVDHYLPKSSTTNSPGSESLFSPFSTASDR